MQLQDYIFYCHSNYLKNYKEIMRARCARNALVYIFLPVLLHDSTISVYIYGSAVKKWYSIYPHSPSLYLTTHHFCENIFTIILHSFYSHSLLQHVVLQTSELLICYIIALQEELVLSLPWTMYSESGCRVLPYLA